MANLDQLTFCQTTCGTNFHSDCIKMWTRQAEQARTPTCPACRQPWTDVKTGGHIIDVDADDGYANLGDLQGQSRVRDTSTYHSYDWRERYKKRRRY
jgi:Zn-finger nucleic acid-binding protein